MRWSSTKWIVLGLSLLMTTPALAAPPCDSGDAECLIDLSLRQTLRAELAEKKLNGCRADLKEAESKPVPTPVCRSCWFSGGVGVAAILVIVGILIAR